MLEHADGNDPIEAPGERAIVDQLETDAIGDTRLFGTTPGDLELLLRQRDPEHVDVGNAVQVKRHPAPAAADVEHALTGLQRQLGGDVRLLELLRLVQPGGRCREIGAAILAVAIEEEIVEPVVEIVMMRDVALRSGGMVAMKAAAALLAQPVTQPARAGERGLPLLPAIVCGDERDERADVVAVDGEAPVHIRLARAQRRIGEDPEAGRRIGEADRDRRMRRIGTTEAHHLSVRLVDDQLAAGDQIVEGNDR